MVDDIGLDEMMEHSASSRRMATPHWGVAFRTVRVLSLMPYQIKEPHPEGVVLLLVDDIGLEPMTFRTSSGCSSQLS